MTNVLSDHSDLTGSLLFAHAIEQAREIMLKAPWLQYSRTPDLEQAAAERQLKHQVAASLDQGFILHDPRHPEFRSLDQHNQFGLFNPDNRYHIATIETLGTYVIHGRRGSSARLEIQVGAGEPGFNENLTSPIPVDELSDDCLKVDKHGHFKITISGQRKPDDENWLSNQRGDFAANSVLIRESFMDWESEKSGTWYIERTDTRGDLSPLPTPELVNEQYARAASYLLGSTKGWIKFVDRLRANLAADRVSLPVETQQGLPGQYNSAGHFAINEHEAIIISVPKSRAEYQSIQVGDLWFNGLDYCRRQTSMTAEQAHLSEDRWYRFVISVKDPEVPNWLDPAGASTSFAFLRWQGLPDKYEFRRLPKAMRVRFDELRKYLPDEPVFTPEQRSEQLAARQLSSLTTPRGF